MAQTDWRLRDGRTAALDFSGDIVNVPSDPSLDSQTLTLSAWIEADTFSDPSGYSGIISRYSTSDDAGYLLEAHSGGDLILWMDGNSRVEASNVLSVGTIHHVAATHDGSDNVKLYVDGEVVGSGTGSPVTSGGYPLNIGRLYVDSDNFHFYGRIDDVQVYDRVIPDSGIKELSGGNIPSGYTPVSHWKFDSGRGTEAIDSTGSNDGTLSGSPEWVDGIAPQSFDSRLVDVPEATKAYNQFAQSATVVLDDPDHVIPGEYPRPTPVTLEAKRDIDSTYSTILGGYVAANERENDRTKLEIFSYDQFIKRADPVFRGYSSTAISTILNDLVTDKTPLSIAEITVVNDKTVTRDWSGEPLEKVIEELAAISAGEEFGATDSGGFYFRPRETATAPRNFVPGEYYGDPSFSESGKQSVNRVTIYYGGTSGSAVQVNDSEAQADLQSTLGTADPVVISAPAKSYPEITNEEAAERKANQILEDRSEILTGELETWEAFDVNPGDVTSVRVPEQGIDRSFRVAELTYSWRDGTKVKLAENTDGVVDALVGLSDDVQRIDNRAANENAAITRFEELALPFVQDLELEVVKIPRDDTQFAFGDYLGALGDPDVGGGLLGDQSGAEEVLRTE